MRALSPLPMVHGRYRAEHSFEGLTERYEAMKKEPLLIRAVLGTPYTPATPEGAIHLDGLLSWAVVHTHPRAPVYPTDAKSGEAISSVVPLPVELAWHGDYGKRDAVYEMHNRRTGASDVLRRGQVGIRPPLWVASDLRPQGDLIRAHKYWHKRYPDTHHDEVKKSKLPNTRAGRNKEMRVPLPTVTVPELHAICVGNGPEVRRLLEEITHVGKKGGSGGGRVLEWRVSSLDQEQAVTREAALRVRPVPVSYLFEAEGEIRLEEGTSYSRMTWSPPYWDLSRVDLAVVRE